MMNRTQFLKNIIGLFGISSLPAQFVKQYTRIYLLQCFVRGFRFYEGPQLLSEMREGNLLQLVREPNNEHDADAIALHFNNKKIGYLPAEENTYLSKFMDAGVVELLAEITHLQPGAAAWENVHVAIYILKETDITELPAYLTMLETPHYHTLKHTNNSVTRINIYNEIEILDGDGFYRELEKNSKTDEIYSIIHGDFKDAEEMNMAVNENRIILNINKLPTDMQNDKVLFPLEEGIIQLDKLMDEKGYVVANINRLAQLSSRISGFMRKVDTKGDFLYEVVFKNKKP